MFLFPGVFFCGSSYPCWDAMAPMLCENAPQKSNLKPQASDITSHKGIHHWWPMVGMVIRTSCSFIWYKTCSFGILRFFAQFWPKSCFSRILVDLRFVCENSAVAKETRVKFCHSWGKFCFSIKSKFRWQVSKCPVKGCKNKYKKNKTNKFQCKGGPNKKNIIMPNVH